jgi:PAS domain S-box-containing protein
MGLALRGSLLAIGYAFLAYVGLRWATALDAASPIWPASGAALAAMLVWGRRLWPAVAAGALAAMHLSGAETPLQAEAAIALGNALAPVLVVTGLKRLGFDRELRRARDLLLLVGAAVAYGVLAGFCGAASLVLLGSLPIAAAGEVLATWATGDATGVLTAGVLLLAWARGSPLPRSRGWWLQFGCAAGLTTGVSWWLFFAGGAASPMGSWQLLPFLVWAALLLDLRATATLTSLAVAIAVAGVLGGGPLPDAAEDALLLAVQRFTAVCTVTLALISVLTETERRAQRALAEEELYRRTRESEARLRRSEEVLRLALEGAGMDAFEWDLETDRCTRARGGQAFLGVDIKPTGSDFFDLVHPDDRAALEAAIRTLTPEAAACNVDYRLRIGEARFTWLRDTLKGEFDGEQRLVRVRGVCADISARRAAQEALAEQEAFTRNLIEASPALTYVWDAENGRNKYASPQTLSILGYAPEEVQAMGPDFLASLLHPEDAPRVFARYQELLTAPEHQVFDLEYRMRRRDGEWVWLYSRDQVLRRGANGEALEFLGVALEITERKRAEDALRASADRLDAAQRAMGALVYDVSEAEAWRSGADHLLGYSTDELAGGADRWLELIHPDDVARATNLLDHELDEEGRYASEYRVRHKDGRWIWVSDRGQKVLDPDGGVRRLIGASFDVTKRVEAERQSVESAARLSLAQAVTRIGTWDWSLRSEGALVSETWREVFGLSIEAAGPVPYETWLACVHPEDREQAAADVQACLSDPLKEELRSEYRTLTSGGEVRWIEARGRLYRDGEGRPERLIGVVVDVSERREAEERQKLLMREVDHRAKNALAVVQAVVRLTRADDKDAFVRAVEGRVQAIARAQTLLASSRWAGASLRRLVEEEAAPFQSGDGSRVRIEGPEVLLEPDAAQPVALALHELFTNAAKYGALSLPSGVVELDWTVEPSRGW